jgi:uncharacterized membrane protein (DUF4010 family)
VIGLLIGIEREKSQHQKEMGVRTFLLICLIGAIAGDLQNSWVSELIAAFVFGLILISYFMQVSSRDTRIDSGMTTEFAAGIVFCLGYTAHQSPVISALLGLVVALILFSKAIKSSELQAALLLLLAGVSVVSLVPDAVIDPWGIFNPRKFGYIVVTLASLEFSSYVLSKTIGQKAGSLVVGFLGGLVSSTAVLISSARRAKLEPSSWRALFCSALAAKLAAFIELLLIVLFVSPALFMSLVLPVGAVLIFGFIALFILAQKKADQISEPAVKSPLDWIGVFRLSIALAAILASVSLAELWLGSEATFTISFLTGLFELHGVSLANATLYSQGKLSVNVATLSVLLGLVASLVAKISISWFISPGIFARALSAVFLSMIAIVVLVASLTYVR